MLKSYFGVILYYLLPSHLSYNLLNEYDKLIIDKANFNHNNYRDDYFDPKKYQGGKSWYTNTNEKKSDYRGYQNIIDDVLKSNPKNILEVGFGSGYYTKNLIYNNSTEYYCGIDINHNFVKFMKNIFLNEKINQKISYNLIQGDISKINKENRRFDLIIFISSFHHIFHRKHVFEILYDISSENVQILMIEPSNYFPRIAKVIIKGVTKYFKKKSWSNINNLSTHHFISVGEIKSYTKGKFKIIKTNFIKQSNFAIKYFFLIKKINKFFFYKFFSSEISILLKKNN